MVSKSDCLVLDADGSNLTDEETVEKVVSLNPKSIGFTVTTMTMPLVNRFARAIKQVRPSIVVLAGGPQATAAPETVLCECDAVDVVFRGEGELVFPQIIALFNSVETDHGHEDDARAVVNNSACTTMTAIERLSLLPGIATRSSPNPKLTTLVQRVPSEYFTGSKASKDISTQTEAQHLKVLPFPRFDGLPIAAYWCPDAARSPMITFMATRGCPFKCAFCATPQVNHRFLPRALVRNYSV